MTFELSYGIRMSRKNTLAFFEKILKLNKMFRWFEFVLVLFDVQNRALDDALDQTVDGEEED